MTKEIENLKRFVNFAISKGLFSSIEAVDAMRDSLNYVDGLQSACDEAKNRLTVLEEKLAKMSYREVQGKEKMINSNV